MGYDSSQDQHYLDLLKSSRYEESGTPSIVFGYESADNSRYCSSFAAPTISMGSRGKAVRWNASSAS